MEISHELSRTLDVVEDTILTMKSQRDRLAEVGERILPILDWLCGDGPNYMAGEPAQLRAELSAILFDLKHGEGQCEK